MNLFEDVEQENSEYINIIDALELVARKIDYETSDIAKRLLLDGFNNIARMFKMNNYGKIELWCSERDFDNGYSTTTEFLNLARSTLGTFESVEIDTFGNEHTYTKEHWFNYYWLKSDFFNSKSIKNLNITEKDLLDFIEIQSAETLKQIYLMGEATREEMVVKEKAKKISEKFFKEAKEFELNDNDQLKKIPQTHIPIEFDYYKFLLFKKPLLSIHEAACIVSNDDPITVEKCENDTNFDQNFRDYLHTLEFLNAAIMANELNKDDLQYYGIKNADLKNYLLSEGFIVEGFNDNLSIKDSFINNPAIQQTSQNTDNLHREIEQLKSELAQAQERIKQLEAEQQVNKSESNNLLSLIFDKTAQSRYAPDLVHAIELWKSVYIDNTKPDSHNNRANTWIKNNTPYSGEQEDSSTRRLREITAPFNDWHSGRKKSINSD